ncbi:FAD-binding oxidoreductase [Parafrankia sp. EUN1f]|uniref:FAD-binding oxidoreductase n=1 Tax=Parafrankia sp. EUN1f TaxID=102897 RepID=UPI0001C46373|nr:FAD-binding oxidoreductase [Parafrankia sp. EUN1f]EFC81451.1 FAD linked oxidase domain protein [Parafrankia sp. EUN1f]
MTAFSDFPGSFRGPVLRPGDSGYDSAREIFNRRAMSTPALIARCADAQDIQTAMRYAARNRMPVAIRGGGHMTEGFAAPRDALVLDMSLLRAVTVDPERRLVRAQPGVLLGEFDRATQRHGLATTAGTVTTTGVAGLTLGGGVGFLMRQFGVTVDNLVSCDVVTAAGEVVQASETENPDLFWALRGGGGNFGVVTSFQYRAHQVGPEVVRGRLIYPIDQAAELLPRIGEYLHTAPRDVMAILALGTGPDLPEMPDSVRAKPALIVILGYTGNPAMADRVLEPLERFGKPAVRLIEKTAYTVLNSTLDVLAPWQRSWHTTGGYLSGLTEDVAVLLVEKAIEAPTLGPTSATGVALWAMGGAVEDVAEESMAFSRANAAYIFEAIANWQDPGHAEPLTGWVDSLAAAIRPHRLPNAYINLGVADRPDWLRDAYGAAKYQRLVELKTRWDPDNLLRFNKNISPSG